MAQGRHFGRAYLLVSLLLLAASLHPSTAYSASADPPSGSPAGAVYQLPLEQGRSDAAPRGSGNPAAGADGDAAAGGHSGQSGEEAGQPSSLYRSENNFGSSSHVPGVAAVPAGANGGSGGATGGDGSSAGVVAAQTSDNGNTSTVAGIVLLGAIALLVVGVGIASRRFSRRSS